MSEPRGFTMLIRRLEELAGQEATGVLTVRTRALEVVLHLRGGEVVRVEDSERRAGTLLAQLAVRRGITTGSRITALLDEKPRCEVGRLLLDAGIVTAERLADLRALQIEETLGLLAVEDLAGDRFDNAAVPVSQPGLKPIPLLELVRDLQRRVAEWPFLRQRFTDRGATVRRVGQLTRTDALAPREQALLAMVDETPVLETLLERSWWGEFPTLRLLYVLSERKLLQLEGDEEAERQQQEARQQLGRAGRGHQLTTVLATVVVFLLVCAAVIRWAPREEARLAVRLPEASLRLDLAQQRLESVRQAIETYRLVEGHLPAELDELVASRCLTERELRFPGGLRRYQYLLQGEMSYLLVPLPH